MCNPTATFAAIRVMSYGKRRGVARTIHKGVDSASLFPGSNSTIRASINPKRSHRGGRENRAGESGRGFFGPHALARPTKRSQRMQSCADAGEIGAG